MQLAKDLTDLIHNYGAAIAAAAEAVLKPRFKPGDPLRTYPNSKPAGRKTPAAVHFLSVSARKDRGRSRRT